MSNFINRVSRALADRTDRRTVLRGAASATAGVAAAGFLKNPLNSPAVKSTDSGVEQPVWINDRTYRHFGQVWETETLEDHPEFGVIAFPTDMSREQRDEVWTGWASGEIHIEAVDDEHGISLSRFIGVQEAEAAACKCGWGCACQGQGSCRNYWEYWCQTCLCYGGPCWTIWLGSVSCPDCC